MFHLPRALRFGSRRERLKHRPDTSLNISLECQVPTLRQGRLVLLRVKLSQQCSSSYLTYGPHLREMDFENDAAELDFDYFFPKIYAK